VSRATAWAAVCAAPLDCGSDRAGTEPRRERPRPKRAKPAPRAAPGSFTSRFRESSAEPDLSRLRVRS